MPWIGKDGVERELNTWYPMNPYPFVRYSRLGCFNALPLDFGDPLFCALRLKIDGKPAPWTPFTNAKLASDFGVFPEMLAEACSV